MKPEFTHTKLSKKSRFTLAAVIYGITAVLQVVMLGGSGVTSIVRWLGIGLLLIPLYVLASKNFSNKPNDVGKEEWKPVTMKEIDRVNDHIIKIKKAPIPAIYDKGFAIGILFVAIFFAAFQLLFGNRAAAFIIVDVYLIFTPWLWFSRIEKWYPKELSRRIREFSQVVTYAWPSWVKPVPYLRFDENPEGLKIPEDFKITAEPAKNKPDDFVGAQFQITYNDGPNGSVPYMYAVFITKGRGDSWNRLRKLHKNDFVTDAGSDGEYGTIVIRLNPDCRSDGYHTKTSDIERLIKIVIEGIGML